MEKQNKRNKKNTTSSRLDRISSVVTILALITGLMLILYPSISDAWNSHSQTTAISTYDETLFQIDPAEVQEALKLAQEYNEKLVAVKRPRYLNDEQKQVYYSMLTLVDDNLIGYVTVPAINIKLPIYHGTSESALHSGVGHLEGSSLPVGGESTHTVLTGHRGLPSARLFSDLDRLKIGDSFQITVYGNDLYYEVDEINIVTPDNIDHLEIEEGQDYATLLTCTPYGVNTHRMLVRGHRIEGPEIQEEEPETIIPAIPYRPYGQTLLLLAGLAAVLTPLMLYARKLGKQDKEKREKHDNKG